jgi:hypothetical protein
VTPGERSRAASGVGWVETAEANRLPSRPSAIIGGLTVADLAATAPPPPDVQRIRVKADGTWWVVTLECHCYCGRFTRAAFGKTVAAAVVRFRSRRREEWMAAGWKPAREEVVATEGSMSAPTENHTVPTSILENKDAPR